jgi:hypothetical protein
MTVEPLHPELDEMSDLSALLPGITSVRDAAEVVVACARRCLDARVVGVARHGIGGPVVLAQTSPEVTDLYAAMTPPRCRTVTSGRTPRSPLGVRVVLTTVLTTMSGRPVTLDVFARRADELATHPPHVRLFLDFAGLVMNSLDRAENLEAALESREVIAQAQGILRERFSLTPAQGMSALRRYSQQSHVKVRDVARAIVDEPSRALGPTGHRTEGAGVRSI